MTVPGADKALFEVRSLTKHFPVPGGSLFARSAGVVRAVDGVNLDILSGETLGLVGESGCGKSTVGRLLVRLLDPTDGQILFDGTDIASLNKRELRALRKDLQIVFQDPFSALNPRMTVGDLVREPIYVQGRQRDLDVEKELSRTLDAVGLARYHADRYPHEFSGGQRQRISIARSLILRPRFIVCDEAVSALDVSIQGQIVNLLQDLQESFHLTYLFIAHALGVVRHISDRVAVMYLGRVVEVAPAERLFERCLHPYTGALLSAVPSARTTRRRQRIVLQGDVPSPARPPSGCRFHTRCPHAQAICRETEPALRDFGNGHISACHRVEDLYPEGLPARKTRSAAQP